MHDDQAGAVLTDRVFEDFAHAHYRTMHVPNVNLAVRHDLITHVEEHDLQVLLLQVNHFRPQPLTDVLRAAYGAALVWLCADHAPPHFYRRQDLRGLRLPHAPVLA